MSTHQDTMGQDHSRDSESESDKNKISFSGQLILIVFYLLTAIGLILASSLSQ
jgi:hypothetical protein